MIGVVGADSIEFVYQFLGDQQGLGVIHSVDHAMANCADGVETNVGFQPIDEVVRRR